MPDDMTTYRIIAPGWPWDRIEFSAPEEMPDDLLLSVAIEAIGEYCGSLESLVIEAVNEDEEEPDA